jgi:hypothetical protein
VNLGGVNLICPKKTAFLSVRWCTGVRAASGQGLP